MSDRSPSLQEFAYPIPICESKVDLGNILNIFRHLKCKMLAIPDRLGGWGVVTAEDLLSVVTESWFEDVASSNCIGNSRTQLRPACRLIPRVKIPLRSAKLYQADLNLNEFLNRQGVDSLFQDGEIYLLVDRQGELQGGIDRHKIIEYFASRSLKPNLESPSYLNYLGSLIDTFALPSKIETDRGRIIYANQQWRTLKPKNSQILEQEAMSAEDTNLDRMTKRWIENQESIQSEPLENLDDSSHNLNRPWKQQANNFSSSDRPDSEIKIDCESDWNYLTIPIVNPEGESEQYNLIVATPTIQSSQLSSHSGLSSSEQSTAHILNAVSHELKSPLTGIVGLSSLLKEQQLGSLNQRQFQYVELIHRSGKKMMRAIDDLLQLNVLTADKSAETEAIDLELLCHQLYQAIVTKIEPLDSNSSPQASPIQPQLSIEYGCEIAIANKSLLSSIVSHLMLEAINSSQNFKQLQIQISNRLGRTTAIIITSQGTASVTNAGFNLTLARYLAATMGATVNNCTSVDRCQLTLLLPKDKIQFLHSAPNPPASAIETHKKLTILCLYPELEVIDPSLSPDLDSNLDLKSCPDSNRLSSNYHYRIIEADSIEQAHNLARIWHLDAIILNGYQIAKPSLYLRSLQKYRQLASLPLITLDIKTTEAANQIEGLNVFPCLLPSQCRSIKDLIQVIQIAIES